MSIIILTHGTIVTPSGPDLTPNTSGYDNAGLFGPAFTNLGDVPYTITWTLGPPSPIGHIGDILDVALTIHGFTYNMGAVPPGDQIGIRSQYGLNAFGNLSYAGFHSELSTLPVGAPNFAGPSFLASYDIDIRQVFPPITNIGQATLAVRGHPYETVVDFAVPNPELGSGIVGLLTIVLMIGLGLYRSVCSNSPPKSLALP